MKKKAAAKKKSTKELILSIIKKYKKAIIAFLAVLLIIYLEFHFFFFTNLSQSKMEKMYDITITKDIKLKRYKKVLMFRKGYRHHLYIDGIENIDEFLFDNCKERKKSYLLLGNDGSLIYEYYSNKKELIEIHFTKVKNGYKAEFILN